MKLNGIQQDIEQEKRRLFSQFRQTEKVWRDKVQTRYYSEFVEPYQKVMPNFLDQLRLVHEVIEKAKEEL